VLEILTYMYIRIKFVTKLGWNFNVVSRRVLTSIIKKFMTNYYITVSGARPSGQAFKKLRQTPLNVTLHGNL